jgi:hypothetical protein
MKKHTATLVLLPLLLGLAGCPLATVTGGFEYDVLKYQNGGDPLDLTGEGGWTDVIDLRDEPDFRDNQDKIENVDRVAFRGFMYTLNESDAVADIVFREPVEEGETPNEWLLIVENLEVRGTTNSENQFEFTYENTEPLIPIKNFARFQTLATSGIIELAVVPRTPPGNDAVMIEQLIIFIAYSGG